MAYIDNFKMAEYFEEDVLEGKVVWGEKWVGKVCVFYLIFLRVYFCELFDLGDPLLEF